MQKCPRSVFWQYVALVHRICFSASSYLGLCQGLLTHLDPDQGFAGFIVAPVSSDFLSMDSGAVGGKESRCLLCCVSTQPNSKAGTCWSLTSNLCFLSCLTTVTFCLWRFPKKSHLTCSTLPSFFGYGNNGWNLLSGHQQGALTVMGLHGNVLVAGGSRDGLC